MSASIRVRPHLYRSLSPEADASFVLLVGQSLAAHVELDRSGPYRDYRVIEIDAETDFARLFSDTLPERAHVLAISPDRLFVSPTREALGNRKLLAMPCNSTPVSRDAIAACLQMLEASDPAWEEEFTERFFDAVESAEHLEIVNEAAGTKAVFRHFEHEHEWNQQAGFVGWGEQQIIPSGELSATVGSIMSFSVERHFALDGTLAIHGQPILHAGSADYARADQARIFTALSSLSRAPVVAHIEGGWIKALRAASPEAEPAREMLQTMFDMDSRYRLIWELGFGINRAIEVRPENLGFNEVYGASHGAFHFGVSLTPHTQYAPIFLCPDSRVLSHDGTLLVGRPPRKLSRSKAAACACYPGGSAPPKDAARS
jgi:hypothetical protein